MRNRTVTQLISLVFIFSGLLYNVDLSAQTILDGGNISGNLNRTDSPYIVTGNLIVPNGELLSIEPGVSIQFQGHYKIFCNGTIYAIGSEDNKITFEASEDNSIGWLGFKYENTPETNPNSVFRNCIISNTNCNIDDNTSSAIGGAFYFENIDGCVIDSCLIKNNYALYGGGAVHALRSTIDVTNNLIIDNKSFQLGEGLDFWESSGTIIGNDIVGPAGGITVTFSENIAIESNTIKDCQTRGGISLFESSKIDIIENLIKNNTNENGSGGGGILLSRSSAKIVSNIITGNHALSSGGGISIDFHPQLPNNSESIISNNLVYNNSIDGDCLECGSGDGGSGIFISNANPIIVSNTIVNNSSEVYGGGLHCIHFASPFLYNNIFQGNTTNSSINNIYLADNDSDPDILNCNIGGSINSNGNPFTGLYENNFEGDADFINPSIGDFSLGENSSCINIGLIDTIGLCIPTFDLAGNRRIINERIDVGAYEFSSGQTSIIPVGSDFEVKIFPNPATDIINIGIASDISFRNTLYSINGKLIFKSQNERVLNLNSLAPGTYLIKVENLKSGQRVVEKIIISQ